MSWYRKYNPPPNQEPDIGFWFYLLVLLGAALIIWLSKPEIT